MKQNNNKNESGEVMIEGMIVMVITMIMLVWILGIGFVYYQKYLVRTVTNDATAKIASTYDAPTSDIIMGYINVKDISKRELYSSPDLTEVNTARAESYIKYMLDKTNFSGVVDDVDVSLEYKADNLGRSHVEVTTKCTINTPFGEGLEMFGMSPDITYSVTSYAESTSINDYASTVELSEALTDGTFLKGSGFVEKTVKMVNSFIGMCKQLFSNDGASNGSGGGGW